MTEKKNPVLKIISHFAFTFIILLQLTYPQLHASSPASTNKDYQASTNPSAQNNSPHCCDRSDLWTNIYAGLEGGFNWTITQPVDGYDANTDIGYGVGGIAGYQFPQGVGLECEIAYRNNRVDYVDYFGLLINAGDSLWCLSWLGNLVYEIPYWCWKPFFGAGLGYSLEHAQTTSYLLPTDENFDNFTYQFFIGFDYNAWKGLDLGIEYKYLHVLNSYIDNHALMIDMKWYW